MRLPRDPGGASAAPGKWVALTRSEIIATGDTPLTVLKAARDKGIAAPMLHRVPQDADTAYFF